MKLFDPGTGTILGFFLKVIAIGYLFGALVHLGNLLGFGPQATAEQALTLRLLDVFYLVLDVLVVVGLWTRAPWGVACFFLAAVSQLVLYLGLPGYFSRTEEEVRAIRSLVGFHVLTLVGYVALRLLNR